MEQNENTPQIEQQAAPASPETPVEQPSEKTPSLEDMLKEAERKAQEHYDAWMYAKAESENIRRRAAEEDRATLRGAQVRDVGEGHLNLRSVWR